MPALNPKVILLGGLGWEGSGWSWIAALGFRILLGFRASEDQGQGSLGFLFSVGWHHGGAPPGICS